MGHGCAKKPEQYPAQPKGCMRYGERLRDNFGLTIREHEHFDPVDPVHSPNSYHYHGEAIDVQDWRDDVIDGVGWKDRTSNLRNLLRGSGPEAPRKGWHSFDYYAPTVGNDRWHSSAEGAPIYIVGQSGRKSGGGSGGGYGNYGYVLDDNGNVVSKSGHGDNSGTVFGGGTFSGTPLPAVGDTDGTGTTPKPAQVEAATRAKEYSKMNKTEMNSAYDDLRKSDPAKAAIEGKKMHRAFFGK